MNMNTYILHSYMLQYEQYILYKSYIFRELSEIRLRINLQKNKY